MPYGGDTASYGGGPYGQPASGYSNPTYRSQSKKKPKKKNTAAPTSGSSAPPVNGTRRPNTYASDMDRARRGTFGSPNPQPIQDPTQYGKSIQDFMNMARQVLQQSSKTSLDAALSGIGAREGALKNQAAASNQNIGQGYKALSSFIGARPGVINQNFGTGIGNVKAANTQAAQTIQQGGNAAQAQQQAILNRLGIGDTNVVLQNKGQTLGAQTAQNIADSATVGQAAQTRLGENQSTALQANTSLGNAAALEGRGAQDKVQQQLMSYLASLQDQRSQAQGTMANATSEANVLGLAQQLMDQDMQVWEGNYGRKYQTEQDAYSRAMAMAQAQQKSSPQMNQTSYAALGPLGQIDYALQNSGLNDPAQRKQVVDIIGQVGADPGVRTAADFIAQVQRLTGGSIDAQNAAAIWWNYFNSKA